MATPARAGGAAATIAATSATSRRGGRSSSTGHERGGPSRSSPPSRAPSGVPLGKDRAGDAPRRRRSCDQPFLADGAVAGLARPVPAFVAPAERLDGSSLAGAGGVEEGCELLALEGDRRALGVVLVVGVHAHRGAHQLGVGGGQLSDLLAGIVKRAL